MHFCSLTELHVKFALVVVGIPSTVVLAAALTPCFTAENPPSCQHRPRDGTIVVANASSRMEIQDECLWIMKNAFVDVYVPETELHLEAFAHISIDSEECPRIRSVYSECVWCAPRDLFFRCNGLLCQRPDVADKTIDINATCKELAELANTKSRMIASKEFCYLYDQVSYLCDYFGCIPSDSVFVPPIAGARGEQSIQGKYLGADTTAKKKAIVWILRVSSLLSAFGGLFIIWDTMLSRKRKNSERIVYNRLLFGMACFDICTALAWSFASAAIPKRLISQEAQDIRGWDGNRYRDVYGAKVIVYQWRETRLKSIQYYMHGFPLLVGMGLAFGILPVYDWSEYGCHLRPSPAGELWKVFVFVFVPIGFSIVWIGTSMLYVYVTVRRTAQASRRWRLGVGPASDREKQVFWQAVFYSLSFLITWPAVFVMYLFSVDMHWYGFTIFVSFVAPVQGFNDCCVYLYPRLRDYWDWEQLSSTLHLSSIFSSRFMSGFFVRETTGTSDTAASCNPTMPSRVADMNNHHKSEDPE